MALLAAGALVALGAAPVAAQGAGSDFSWARLELGVLGGPGEPLLEAWDPARGLYGHVALPWGGGELSGRVEAYRHAPRGTEPGVLDEARVVAGWAWPVTVAAPLHLRVGAELGLDYFRLPRAVNPGETEVSAGLVAEAGLRVTRGWELVLGGRRHWTFTEPGLRRDALSLGLARTLGVPARVVPLLGGDGRVGAGSPPQATRWADPVHDLPGWLPTTVDAVTVGLAPPGTPSAAAARVAVRVDRWPIPLDLLGVTSLDRLPVEPVSAEGVEANAWGVDVPAGFDGALDVRTAPLAHGVSAAVGVQGANATGDGGPRALVVGYGPNVESLEWGWWARGGWAGDALAVRAEGGHHRRWVTELPVFRRNFEVVDPDVRWPWVDLVRGRLGFAASVGGFRHEASLLGSSVDDFFLAPGLPREVPARTRLGAAWLRSEGPLAPGVTVSGGLGRTVNRLELTDNLPGWALDWRETLDALRGEVRTAAGGVELALERRTLAADVPLDDARDGIATLDGDLRVPLGGVALALAGRALRADGAWGGGAWSALERTTDGGAVGVRAGVEVTPPAARGGPWLARERGLDVPARWGVGVGGEADAPLATSRRWTGEAWSRRALPSAWVEARVRVDRVRGGWLAEAPVAAEAGVPRPAGPLAVVPDARGTMGWLGLRWSWTPHEALELGGSHDVRGVLDGGGPLRAAHATLPRHRSVHRGRWWPRPDLALTARLEARSAARWEAWTDAGPDFPAVLPGGLVLDLGAEKAVLAGRGVLSMTVRDVLDRELASHPLAGTPGLTLEVGARLTLGAQPSPDASSPRRRR